MKESPISAYRKTVGMLYFARMLDKIRKHAKGTLREDFHTNLGKGFDKRCIDYLRIDYSDLKKRTMEGGSDEEILYWCFDSGRRLSDGDILIWNEFLRKVGWKDFASKSLAQRKIESNLESNTDIETMLDYFEFDEGRTPQKK